MLCITRISNVINSASDENCSWELSRQFLRAKEREEQISGGDEQMKHLA